MQQLLTPFRKRVEARYYPSSSSPVVSAALHAPRGSLPPVCHADGQRTTCPPGRIARHLDGDGQRRRDITRLPVQRRTDRRSVPDGSRLQLQQQLHMEPHAAGHAMTSR